MKTLKTFLFIFIFFIVASTSTTSTNTNKIVSSNVLNSNLKIVIIHSYNVNHICGEPQNNGIVKAINELPGVNPVIRKFYLNGKGKTDKEVLHVQAEIINKIEEFKPDYIFTIDDLAFKMFALNDKLKKYPFFFTGLNKSFVDYNIEYNIISNYKNIIGGIDEIVNFDKLRDIINLDESLNKREVIVLLDNTDVSSYLYRDFLISFKDTKHKKIIINNFQEYKNFLDNNEHRYNEIIIINLLQVLFDSYNQKYLKDYLIKYMSTYYNYFQVTTNKDSLLFGAHLVVGIDFEEMGYLAGKIFLQYINIDKNKFDKKNNILIPKTYYFLNIDELKKINYYPSKKIIYLMDKI